MSHTLLLADDSETTHRVVTLMFAERDVRVVSVMSGQQAVERLSAEPPDIVLAAISLPKVDGFQVADFMRGQPQLQNVPILLLSGAFDDVDEERVRQSGASGVLVKPFESELVINRVKELLGLGGKSDRPVTPPGGRLFPQEAPPQRPSLTGPRGAGAPAPRPDSPPRQDPPPSTHTGHEPPSNLSVPPAPNDASEPPSARNDASQDHGGGEPPQQPAAWDQLREQSGLGPETAHVESGSAGGADDYFDRLDAAFDNLDAQLSGHSPSRPRDAAATTRRMPTPDDSSTRRLSPVHQDGQSPEARRTDTESPYEDADWFNDQPSPPSGQPATPPSDGEAPPVYVPPPPTNTVPAVPTGPVAPAAPAAPVYRAVPVATVAPATSFADAFDHLLAAEQGEVQPPVESQVQGPFIEISDEAIERIATRVAERLSQGVFVDSLTNIVNAVSERLVREEIARIRSAAQGKKS